MKDNSTNQENSMDKMRNLAKRQISLKNNQTKNFGVEKVNECNQECSEEQQQNRPCRRKNQ